MFTLIYLLIAFSISSPQYVISASTCTIKGNGKIDQNSYRASGSYKTFTIINIGTEITELGKECFSYSSELRTINFDSSSKLTKIGDYALDSCEKLESFNIPDSVEIIGARIMRACYSIQNFYIGPRVESIGEALIY